ncbi:hypothetical protein [uncultured Christiangramia sp.]|uniref:hypothetical protein n=1 Tax=uncultured Christiangramia sp. TaxID=503836 RepID=UPI00261BD124|nr:hypothetical protein [uncultured Christiangramia sp.]
MEKGFSLYFKNIIYITILSFIISCDSKKELNGTWIGAYSYSDNLKSSFKSPIRVIVNFDEDKYLSRSFKYDYRSENNIEKGNLTFNGKKIIYDSNNKKNDIIQSLNNDSLIIKGFKGSNNSVYKKLDNSLKNRSKDIQLTGKSFQIRSGKNVDTLNFVSDSLILSNSDKSRKPGTKWERIKQNGFDILFMEMNVPLLIQEKIDDTIYLKGLYKKVINFKLIELKRMPTTVHHQ